MCDKKHDETEAMDINELAHYLVKKTTKQPDEEKKEQKEKPQDKR